MSLDFEGLESNGGALQLLKKGEALAQHRVGVSEDYYGSFRLRVGELTNNSVIGLLLSSPMSEGLTPKTALLSFLPKAWQSEYGVLLVNGRPVKLLEGEAMATNQSYLVVFQVINAKGADRSVSMWILNEAQVAKRTGPDWTSANLNRAPLSKSAEGVLQRVQHPVKKSDNLTISKGDVVACVAKYCPNAIFDEIRVSTSSLQAAVGSKK
jgi:hypothetical protein